MTENMTENDIKRYFATLREGMKTGQEDIARDAALVIAECLVINVNIIAISLAILASAELDETITGD